ncbi:MAG: hypothetical protein HYZ92_01370 [Candidatus Omnitrophica bacterium]|nr:hypothetical protein [Candidatus Omnitrophota bacterium]
MRGHAGRVGIVLALGLCASLPSAFGGEPSGSGTDCGSCTTTDACDGDRLRHTKTCTNTACNDSYLLAGQYGVCGYTWAPYGFALPGDPTYGFNYPDPNTRDLLGLAAKGNVVIGDYTNPDFGTYVAPRLTPGGLSSVVQPYVVDPTDASLGYDSLSPSLCGGRSPCFDGDYTATDSGEKSDHTPRKFYESSLPDAEFHALLDQARSTAIDPYYSNWTGDPNYKYASPIDGVLYTNHALTGLVETRYFWVDGAMIARDEALRTGPRFDVYHDIRLLDQASTEIGLPIALKRLKLKRWQDCAESGC